MAEARAVRNASSRRGQTSITHLLNYSAPMRHHLDHGYHNRVFRRSTHWGLGTDHDKARYVHANYRFVVSPAGTYTTQAADADEHLAWADVLQVIASAESQATSCPICLSEPTAPRMAKCGHIFCLPCLLRFMDSASTDDADRKEPKGRRARWKKCPICEEPVYLADARPLRFYAGQESPPPRPGDDVVLRLMVRNAKSTLALPREGASDVLNAGSGIPWHFAANVLDYARIMKGTGDYMTEQFDREIEELLAQEKEDELMFHEDGEWTQKAIKGINAAKDKVRELGGMEAALSDETTIATPAATATPSTAAEPRPPDHDFYFYSALPHLYLSPLDIRILKPKYGSFSLFPSTLLPRVEHVSTGHVVDDAVRKRAKYLGHLPHGCVISFLECDWTDIVPADILDTFAGDIERRRKRNKDKAAQEERERLQAERLEREALHRSGAARRQHLAHADAVDEDGGVTVRFGNAAASLPEPAVVDPSEFAPLGAGAGTPPKNPRAGFTQLAAMSTSPGTSRTVWGTPAVATSPDLAPLVVAGDVDDGWLRDEQFMEELGAADLALQMEALGVENPGGGAGGVAGGGVVTASGGGGTGGKKKKKQKITLMSTGGRRGG